MRLCISARAAVGHGLSRVARTYDTPAADPAVIRVGLFIRASADRQPADPVLEMSGHAHDAR